MIWPDGHACIKGPWLGWRQSVGEPWFPMGPSKILGGCDVRSQEFVPVQSCHISCQLAMSQSESAYSAIADWHWTTSNTTEVAIRAPYGDMGTSQRRNGDVRTWWHVGKIGPWRRDLWCHRVIVFFFFFGNVSNCWLNSYGKFGGGTRRRFFPICEIPEGGGKPPPAVRGSKPLAERSVRYKRRYSVSKLGHLTHEPYDPVSMGKYGYERLS